MYTEGTASRPPTAKGLTDIGVQSGAPRFIGADLLTDRAQGPRTYKTGPRYACSSGTALSRQAC
jgi:hypothetical protein